MKSFLMGSLLLGVLGLVGCNNTPEDRKANEIRKDSKDQAEREREAAKVAAEKERDKAGGRTIGGEALDSTTEKKADAIENEGERRADKVKREGENAADAVEEQK